MAWPCATEPSGPKLKDGEGNELEEPGALSFSCVLHPHGELMVIFGLWFLWHSLQPQCNHRPHTRPSRIALLPFLSRAWVEPRMPIGRHEKLR